jgi:hypothetical protein
MLGVWPEVKVRKALRTASWIKVHNALCGLRTKGDFATKLNDALHVSHTATPSLFSPKFSPNAVTTQGLSAYSNSPLGMTLPSALPKTTTCLQTYVYQKDERAPNLNFQSPEMFYFPVLMHPHSQISVWLFVGLVFSFSLVYFFLLVFRFWIFK